VELFPCGQEIGHSVGLGMSALDDDGGAEAPGQRACRSLGVLWTHDGVAE
jgi:hypothetical protein